MVVAVFVSEYMVERPDPCVAGRAVCMSHVVTYFPKSTKFVTVGSTPGAVSRSMF